MVDVVPPTDDGRGADPVAKHKARGRSPRAAAAAAATAGMAAAAHHRQARRRCLRPDGAAVEIWDIAATSINYLGAYCGPR